MTLNQIKTLFKYIGDSHYFIKTTEYGTVPSKVEANTDKKLYPAFYQVLTDSTQLTNTIQRTYTLIVCDLVYPGQENLDEVHSDTEQTLSDIIKILRQESDYYDVIGDPQIVPFKDRYGDAVAGHEATVVIETLYNSGFCDIPSDTFGYPGTTGTNGIPFPPQFDCDSLASCSVIQGIQTDISTLFSDSIFTATNGLTKTLNNVDWGGPLDQNTTITGNNFDVNLNNLNNFIVNTNNYLMLKTTDQLSGRISNSEHYVLNGFTGQSWFAKDGVIENQLIHTTNQFAVTYDSFARIPLNVRRFNPNGEGILETLPTYAYTTNADTLNGMVGVNSTGELFNTGINVQSGNVNFNNYSLNGIASVQSNGIVSGSNSLFTYNDLFAFGAPAQPSFEYVRMYSTAAKVLSMKGVGNNFIANLSFSTISANRTYTLQNASGTLAFLSDIPSLSGYLTTAVAAATYVPYTGAITNVNLGNNNLYFGTGNTYDLDIKKSNSTGLQQVIGSVQNTNTAGSASFQVLDASGTRYVATFVTNSASAYGDIYLPNRAFVDSNADYLWLTNIQPTGKIAFNVGTFGTSGQYLEVSPTGTAWQFLARTRTALTASTETVAYRFSGTTSQFNTGTLALQRSIFMGGSNYSFVGASTITDSYNLYVASNNASTNATITNNYSAGFEGGTKVIDGTANLISRSWVGLTANFALYFNATTPSGTNYTLGGSNTDTYLNAPQANGNILMRVANNTIQNTGNTAIVWTPQAASSGALTTFNWTKPNNTGQTTNTAIPGWTYNAGSRTWTATATITTQRENQWLAPTYNAGTASTITTSVANYFEAAVAGTNVTITNNYAISANAGIQVQTGSMTGQGIVLRDLVGTPAQSGIYMTVAPTSTNYALRGDSSGNSFVNGGQVFVATNGTSRILLRDSDISFFNWVNPTTGASSTFNFTKANPTGQTASTAITGWNVIGGNRTWATGNIVTQIENNWGDVTYSFAASSTITTAYGNFFRAPTAGTNATITNNFAIGTTGAIQVNDGTIAGGIRLQAIVGTTADAGIYAQTATPSGSNYIIRSSTNATVVNAPNVVQQAISNTAITTLRGATSASSNSWFVAQQLASTNLTASTEATGVLFSNVSKQFATGTFATQREFYITGMTYSAVGASTITNSYSLYVDAPVAGTNMTLTNRYGIGTNGAIIATGSITSSSVVTGSSIQALDFQSSGATMTIRTRPGNVSFIQFSTTGTTPTESWRMDTNGNLSSTLATGTANISLKASTTAYAHLNLAAGVAPTSPNNGDMWFDGTDFKVRIGGVTKTLVVV